MGWETTKYQNIPPKILTQTAITSCSPPRHLRPDLFAFEAIISPSNRVVDRGPSEHAAGTGSIWHRVFLARFNPIQPPPPCFGESSMRRRAPNSHLIQLSRVQQLSNAESDRCSTIFNTLLCEIVPLDGDKNQYHHHRRHGPPTSFGRYGCTDRR